MRFKIIALSFIHSFNGRGQQFNGVASIDADLY